MSSFLIYLKVCHYSSTSCLNELNIFYMEKQFPSEAIPQLYRKPFDFKPESEFAV